MSTLKRDRGQTLLPVQDSLLGLPRGRRAGWSPRRRALLVTRPSSPKGQRRRTQLRNAFGSASVWGSFTLASHVVGSTGSGRIPGTHNLIPKMQLRVPVILSTLPTNPIQSGIEPPHSKSELLDGIHIPRLERDHFGLSAAGQQRDVDAVAPRWVDALRQALPAVGEHL